jgi:hypothetical protein
MIPTDRRGHEVLEKRISATADARGHSVVDIAATHLGSILQSPDHQDDLLGEMLDGRQSTWRKSV